MGFSKYFDKLGRRLKLALAVIGEIRPRSCFFVFVFYHNMFFTIELIYFIAHLSVNRSCLAHF